MSYIDITLLRSNQQLASEEVFNFCFYTLNEKEESFSESIGPELSIDVFVKFGSVEIYQKLCNLYGI